MDQVDQAMRRAAYDIGYKSELIGVLEAEVIALREGRTDDADVLRQAREQSASKATTAERGRHGAGRGSRAGYGGRAGQRRAADRRGGLGPGRLDDPRPVARRHLVPGGFRWCGACRRPPADDESADRAQPADGTEQRDAVVRSESA